VKDVVLSVSGLVLRGGAILRGGTFEVRAGEIVAIVGPSGAGKSTLLRAVAALGPFDAGTVRIGSSTIGPRTTTRALVEHRRHLAFVFQEAHLFAHRTALENVIEAPVHVHGRTKSEAEAHAWVLLERLGVKERAHARPSELSGGEQQRVALARALAADRKLLLLDEPTSALDGPRKQIVVDVLREIADRGVAVLLVTHDPALAEAATRRIEMDRGELR
jgi:polar amino acid transport system ATP-binding protein